MKPYRLTADEWMTLCNHTVISSNDTAEIVIGLSITVAMIGFILILTITVLPICIACLTKLCRSRRKEYKPMFNESL